MVQRAAKKKKCPHSAYQSLLSLNKVLMRVGELFPKTRCAMTEPERRRMELALARYDEAMTAWNWSPRTRENYGHNSRVFFDWLARETECRTLAEVSAETIASYQTAILSFEKLDGAHLSTTTQHGRLVAVRAFFRFLVREGHLLMDPTASLVLPKASARLPQSLLTPKEAIALVESIDTSTPLGLRDRAILEVLYASGLRSSELCTLGVTDFDPDAQTLSVRAGKGNRDRVVPLGPIAAAVLGDYLAQARPKLATAAGVLNLFVTKGGRACHRNAVNLLVRRAARRAGITKPVRPHRLRHACATHLLAGGADIRHVQKLLGHRTLSATQIYTRVEISDLQAVHRKFHPSEKGRRK